MTQETTQSEMFPLPEYQRDDFKIHFMSACNGILSSIPFGVTVDPNAIANAAKNVALAMLNVQREVCGE
ncbi:MAG: hypothetical protein ACKO0Z_12170 [Betaproteobacteria bacterium]